MSSVMYFAWYSIAAHAQAYIKGGHPGSWTGRSIWNATLESASLNSQSLFAWVGSTEYGCTPLLTGNWASCGTSSAMSTSSQYTPPMSFSKGLVAHHAVVAAPCGIV